MEKVSIAIPFHLRGKSSHAAYEIAFRHYSRMPYVVHLCGSEEDLSRTFAKRFLNETTQYREVPQSETVDTTGGHPVLKKKFNDSLKTLPDSEWRCLVGADDVVSLSFFQALEKIQIDDECLAGVKALSLYYLYDLDAHAAKRIVITPADGQVLSSGVSAINARAMKINGGNPFYAEGAEIGLELEMHRRGGVVIPLNGFVVNIKSGNPLHSFDVCLQYNKSVDCHQHELKLIQSIIHD